MHREIGTNKSFEKAVLNYVFNMNNLKNSLDFLEEYGVSIRDYRGEYRELSLIIKDAMAKYESIHSPSYAKVNLEEAIDCLIKRSESGSSEYYFESRYCGTPILKSAEADEDALEIFLADFTIIRGGE